MYPLKRSTGIGIGLLLLLTAATFSFCKRGNGNTASPDEKRREARAIRTLPELLETLKTDSAMRKALGIREWDLLQKYYAAQKNDQLWWPEGLKEPSFASTCLMPSLARAAFEGLSDTSLHLKELTDISRSRTDSAYGSALLDLWTTDAALQFFRQLAYGRNLPANSWTYRYPARPDTCIHVPSLLTEICNLVPPDSIIRRLEPRDTAYICLKSELGQILRFGMPVDSGNIYTGTGKALNNSKWVRSRLLAHAMPGTAGNKDIRTALQKFGYKFGIRPWTPKKDSLLEQALSMPVIKRIEALQYAMDRLRMERCTRSRTAQVIQVNTAGAYLRYFDLDTLKLSMKVICGESDKQTPLLISRSGQVVAYPYWKVPRKIAVEELLPKIQNDVGYLARNHYQVLINGHVVNPWRLRWKKYNKNYFPVQIRQMTGEYNALGILKLNFPNPKGVYLHDTNLPGLFGRDERHLSHGCVRMEKPYELVKLLLPDTAVFNETRMKTWEKKGSPTYLSTKKQVAIIISYFTAFPDEKGEVIYYPDIYSRYLH